MVLAVVLPAVLALGIAVGSEVAMTEHADGARAHAAEAAEPEPGPLRVMVEGDSISQGFAGDHTWRQVPVDGAAGPRGVRCSNGAR